MLGDGLGCVVVKLRPFVTELEFQRVADYVPVCADVYTLPRVVGLAAVGASYRVAHLYAPAVGIKPRVADYGGDLPEFADVEFIFRRDVHAHRGGVLGVAHSAVLNRGEQEVALDCQTRPREGNVRVDAHCVAVFAAVVYVKTVRVDEVRTDLHGSLVDIRLVGYPRRVHQIVCPVESLARIVAVRIGERKRVFEPVYLRDFSAPEYADVARADTHRRGRGGLGKVAGSERTFDCQQLRGRSVFLEPEVNLLEAECELALQIVPVDFLRDDRLVDVVCLVGHEVGHDFRRPARAEVGVHSEENSAHQKVVLRNERVFDSRNRFVHVYVFVLHLQASGNFYRLCRFFLRRYLYGFFGDPVGFGAGDDALCDEKVECCLVLSVQERRYREGRGQKYACEFAVHFSFFVLNLGSSPKYAHIFAHRNFVFVRRLLELRSGFPARVFARFLLQATRI